MKYCINCKWLTGEKCNRLVDHPVNGPNAGLNLFALVQRLGIGGNTSCYHEPYGYCGPEAKYWEQKSFMNTKTDYGTEWI